MDKGWQNKNSKTNFPISYQAIEDKKMVKLVLDDVSKINGKNIEVWTTYSPHTISKRAKSCERCHENPLLFMKKTQNEILNLKIPTNLIDATPLSKKQLV